MSGVSVGVDETIFANGKPISYGELSSDWTQFQYDARNTGYNPYATAPTNGSVKWTTTVGDQWGKNRQSLFVDGYIYTTITGSPSKIFKMNPSDGSVASSYSFDASFDGTPSTGDGRLYYANGDLRYHGYDLDLSLQWDTTRDYGHYTSTYSQDTNVIYTGVAQEGAAALNPDGSEKWRNESISGDLKTAPAVADGQVYFPTEDPWIIHALDATDGTQLWTRDGSGETFVDRAHCTVGSDGTVYAVDFDELIALNPDGSRQWGFTLASQPEYGAAVKDPADTVVISGGDTLYAINTTDGTKRWSVTPSSSDFESSPAIAENVVYMSNMGGNLYAFDIADGSQIWSVSNGSWFSMTPSIAEGVVYSGGGDNNELYAIE